jgi:hypothetical protein
LAVVDSPTYFSFLTHPFFLGVAEIKWLNNALYILRSSTCQLNFYIFIMSVEESFLHVPGDLQILTVNNTLKSEREEMALILHK